MKDATNTLGKEEEIRLKAIINRKKIFQEKEKKKIIFQVIVCRDFDTKVVSYITIYFILYALIKICNPLLS